MIAVQNVGLRVQVYADGADLQTMQRLADDPNVQGFTTNPTLMHRAALATTSLSAGRSWIPSGTSRCPSRSWRTLRRRSGDRP